MLSSFPVKMGGLVLKALVQKLGNEQTTELLDWNPKEISRVSLE